MRAGAVALLAMASVVVATGSPATAQTTPTVVVTPDAVASGDLVDVQISGFTRPENGTAVICEAAVVQAGFDESMCRPWVLLLSPPFPARVQVPATGIFDPMESGTGDTNCALVEGGCVIGFVQFETGSSPLTAVAEAYDAIAFYPTLSSPDRRNLADGDSVAISGSLVPRGDWSLAQCGRAYLDDPTPARAAALCGQALQVSADAEATFEADLVVHDPVIPRAPGAPLVGCRYDGCVVVVSNASVPLADYLELSFGPPKVDLVPNGDLSEWATIDVLALGMPADVLGQLVTAQCVLPLGPTLDESRCGPQPSYVGLNIDRWGSGRSSVPVKVQLPVNDGTPVAPEVTVVDCRVTSCGIGLFEPGSNGEQVASSSPLRFATPPPFTITPSTGLVEGQPVTVAASGLAPGQYRLDLCLPAICTPGAPVTVGSSGGFTTQAPAQRRFTTETVNQYCRDLCSLYLWSVDRVAYVAHATFAFAEGDVAVTPSTGLTDLQTVLVTGDRLSPSYVGPAFAGFPSGGWWIVQCNRRFVDSYSPTIRAELAVLGVLFNCSMAPPGVPVTVTGSTLWAPFTVRSRISHFLFQTTDCTAEPGACVVGLIRLEQDGTLTQRLVPVTFAPGT